MSFTTKCILHNMDGDEVRNLRDLVCKMPVMSLTRHNLRTASEVRTVFRNLSDKNSRMKAIENELERLVQKRKFRS